MNREKLTEVIKSTLPEVIKSAYQKGYREGFTDACDLMRNATADLVQSMAESLEGHTIVVDEYEGEE